MGLYYGDPIAVDLAERAKRFRCLVRKYQRLLRLTRYRIRVDLSKSPRSDDPSTLADIDLNEAMYNRAYITVYPRLLTSAFPGMAERTAIHELLHVVLWPLVSFAENTVPKRQLEELSKLEEMVITHLELALHAALSKRGR